jgi:predicted NAD/FAD-dependent oxidoreductase
VTAREATLAVDTAIVGAGIAGLASACALRDAGRAHVVLERSRGVGGRCATRRVDGQAVDHGAAFLHGSNEGFLGAVREVPGASRLDGWPRAILGNGPACLPKAFGPLETRMAYADGLTVFPKHMARGLEVRLEAPVVALSSDSGGILVHTEAGSPVRAASVVLAVPAPASWMLLRPLCGESREAAAVGKLLGMIGSQACLTAIAGYAPQGSPPPWDAWYPEDSASVQMISHDSTKRKAPSRLVLVVQARPCWSRVNMAAPQESWAAELVQETARILGPWAGDPLWVQPHRWRFARTDRGSEMSRPLVLRVPEGGRVVVTGEAFAPGGGIEAAWLAGRASARRLLEEE